MARDVDPEEKRSAPPDVARADAPEPPVDPRFRFTVSVPTLDMVSSARGGWEGALLAEGDAGPVRSGEVRHEHQAIVIQRWETPNHARPIGSRGGWTTIPPGVRLFMPGDREFGEWRGHPWAQFLFVSPERVEAVLGKPWEASGLTRWCDERHSLPFVEHVVSAMMDDIEAGHPAGPITGDALVVALLLHLDGAGATAPAPGRGALGRRLDVLLDHIEENLARPLRLAELAALAGVEVGRIGAIFAAETGCSPARYLQLRRIERAKRLARDPDLTLAQVARAVGFADETQLARAFRQHAGDEPGAHRRH
jgi:AraC-like DNA-binding protein